MQIANWKVQVETDVAYPYLLNEYFPSTPWTINQSEVLHSVMFTLSLLVPELQKHYHLLYIVLLTYKSIQFSYYISAIEGRIQRMYL